MLEQLIYWRLLAGVAGAGVLLDFVGLVFLLFLYVWYLNFVDSKFRLCHSKSAVRDFAGLPLFCQMERRVLGSLGVICAELVLLWQIREFAL